MSKPKTAMVLSHPSFSLFGISNAFLARFVPEDSMVYTLNGFNGAANSFAKSGFDVVLVSVTGDTDSSLKDVDFFVAFSGYSDDRFLSSVQEKCKKHNIPLVWSASE